MIGYWLHPTIKEKIFTELEVFSKKQQLAIPFKRY